MAAKHKRRTAPAVALVRDFVIVITPSTTLQQQQHPTERFCFVLWYLVGLVRFDGLFHRESSYLLELCDLDLASAHPGLFTLFRRDCRIEQPVER